MCFFPIKDLSKILVSSIPTDFLYLLLLVRCEGNKTDQWPSFFILILNLILSVKVEHYDVM